MGELGRLLNRRTFLRSTSAAGLGALAASIGHAQVPQRRRTFEIVTRVHVLQPQGRTRIWIPAPLIHPTAYQQSISNTFAAEGGHVRLVEASPHDALGIVAAEFEAGVVPIVTVTSRVVTTNHAVDLSVQRHANLEEPMRGQFLRPTKLLPLDGVVRTTANDITRSARTELDSARAIYDWIVEHTYRDSAIQGCGLGDIRFMLETKSLGGKSLGGKCADLNALFVGLARAAGLPARDVYGIRVAPSQLGYSSLGTASSIVTKSQHCRAEVFLTGIGWVPVDPADVRKVMLEEPPGGLSMADPKVRRAREQLFGAWETNWIAYNFAHDVTLPGSTGRPLPFFMYPQAETGERRLDCLAPDDFRYEITAREI